MKEQGGGVRRLPTSHLQSPPPPPPQPAAPAAGPGVSEVSQPYRTTPLVLPHAKTIHSVGKQGNRFLTQSTTQEESQPYRTSSLIMPGPRTIHEVRGGAPSFTPYRGPQYWADKGFTPVPLSLPTITQHAPNATRPLHPQQLYNSPVNLYSDQALAEALIKPVAVTGTGTAAPRQKYQVKSLDSFVNKFVKNTFSHFSFLRSELFLRS